MKHAARIAALSIVIALSASARQQQPRWRDTFASRVEALALLRTLNGDLLASPSATKTLEAWCGDHHMAAVAKIVATKLAVAAKEPSAEQLQRLRVHDANELRYRRVELRCGAHVLSAADNWYVPARLTPEMNAQLETSDTPFGRAVAPLHPYRRTIEVVELWSPLPRGWEEERTHAASHPKQVLAMPEEVFRHRALLFTENDVPFAEVVETYRSAVLDF